VFKRVRFVRNVLPAMASFNLTAPMPHALSIRFTQNAWSATGHFMAIFYKDGLKWWRETAEWRELRGVESGGTITAYPSIEIAAGMVQQLRRLAPHERAAYYGSLTGAQLLEFWEDALRTA
jgi:hypothetical protein